MIRGQRTQVGYTYDGQEKLEYDLHLALRIARVGDSRYAYIGKSRLRGFREYDNFDWSYQEFASRYGQDVIERDTEKLVLATSEQIDELNRLLAIVKMPDDWQGKVLKAALVDEWEEMDADKMDACLKMLKDKISP